MVAAFIPISAFTRMFRKATQLQETSTVSDMFYCRMNVRRRRGALEPVGGEDGPPISSSPSMPVPGTTSFAPSSPREHATTCEKSSTVDGAAGSSGIGNTMPLTAGNSIGTVPKRAVINRLRLVKPKNNRNVGSPSSFASSSGGVEESEEEADITIGGKDICGASEASTSRGLKPKATAIGRRSMCVMSVLRS